MEKSNVANEIATDPAGVKSKPGEWMGSTGGIAGGTASQPAPRPLQAKARIITTPGFAWGASGLASVLVDSDIPLAKPVVHELFVGAVEQQDFVVLVRRQQDDLFTASVICFEEDDAFQAVVSRPCRAASAKAKSGGRTPSFLAQASRSASVWQQQVRQQKSAVAQPQGQLSHGNRSAVSEEVGRGTGIGTPAAVTSKTTKSARAVDWRIKPPRKGHRLVNRRSMLFGSQVEEARMLSLAKGPNKGRSDRVAGATPQESPPPSQLVSLSR
jgi:hypothetical protein